MKIGFHLSIAGGFDKSLQEAERLGCEVAQIFVKNPRSWKDRIYDEAEKESFSRLASFCPVYAHLSYLPNLAKIDIDQKNLTGFLREAEICDALGIRSLVVHCGSRNDKKEGIRNVAQAVKNVMGRSKVRILLENSSGQGNAIGSTIGELGAIYERVGNNKRLFLCLDTAHLFQSGYDISSPEGWDRIVGEVVHSFGENRIAFFHLNDSKTKRGSRVDRHWHIGKGEVGLNAFRLVMNDQRFARLAGVMETPKTGKMDEENIKIMKSLSSSLVSRTSS